ncbi:MAG: Trk system potassium transporter TrkA [Clostridia bacterium]|nr:Trk system potassium transporter TrkA [Clostridia bacterium]
MKVVIVGLGRVGLTLAKVLCEEGHDIVAIERNAETLQESVNHLDIQGIVGNGCVAENLQSAGVAQCDLFVAVTAQDENNLLCCMVARVLGAKRVVARVRDPEYYEQFQFMRESLGINSLVNPEVAASHEISRILRFPTAMKVSSFSAGKVEIIECKIPSGCKLIGASLAEIGKQSKPKVLVVAIERDGKTFIPDGSTVLQEDDVINVCAKHAALRTFFRNYGLLKHRVQSVVILGGGRDAFYLARMLEESAFSVKIIAHDYDRCREIKSGLKHTQVVCGDYTDREILDREGISDADAVVCMSEHDENNIVIALYAKEQGVEKVIPLLHGDGYRGLLENIKLESSISPYRLAAAELARYLRAIDVEEGHQVLAMYKIANEGAEALLFKVDKDERFIGKPLKDLKIKRGNLISAVIRNATVHIPDGNFVLEENDEIVVVSTAEQLYELEEILQS